MKPALLLLVFAIGCGTPAPEPKPAETKQASVPPLPRTVQEAVDSILARMPPEDQSRLRATPRKELINTLHSWGRGIRNEFGLWGQNEPLLKDCKTDSPEGASMVIMEATWDRLQK